MDVLTLTFVGMDSWNRPVYETDEGQLLVDTDPRYCSHTPIIDTLCTKSGNDFDGEPDTPFRYITKYKDVSIITFVPERKMWR